MYHLHIKRSRLYVINHFPYNWPEKHIAIPDISI